MAKNLVVTNVETGKTGEPVVISFNAERGGKDLQFRLLQSRFLTQVGIAVHDYGTIIVPQSFFESGTQNIILDVEIIGSFTAECQANFSLTNIKTVGAYVELTTPNT